MELRTASTSENVKCGIRRHAGQPEPKRLWSLQCGWLLEQANEDLLADIFCVFGVSDDAKCDARNERPIALMEGSESLLMSSADCLEEILIVQARHEWHRHQHLTGHFYRKTPLGLFV